MLGGFPIDQNALPPEYRMWQLHRLYPGRLPSELLDTDPLMNDWLLAIDGAAEQVRAEREGT